MLDQNSYNQINRAFDALEKKRLGHLNKPLPLTLDYDDILKSLEELPINEVSSDTVHKKNADEVSQETRRRRPRLKAGSQKPDLKVESRSHNFQGPTLYSWDMNADVVQVENAVDAYQKSMPRTETVPRNYNSQGSNLYSWYMRSNKMRVANAADLDLGLKHFNKKSKFLEGDLSEAKSKSSSRSHSSNDLNPNESASDFSPRM